MPTLSRGDLLAFIGVAIFAGTYPATKFALAGGLTPAENAWWRAAIAGVLAALVLRAAGVARPAWPVVGRLAIAGIGMGMVFPFGVGWALQHVPSAHAAVVVAALPLATVTYGWLRGSTTPTLRFWLGGLFACGLVLIFAWRHVPAGGTGLDLPDLALLIAILGAAVGYVEGGRVAQELPSWQVISWALVCILPVSLLMAVGLAWQHHVTISGPAWLGLAYGSLLSMYLGFFPWYAAMQRIGVARVSQIQYVQPFLAIGYGMILLDEHLAPGDLVLAVGVVAAIAWGRAERPVVRAATLTAPSAGM